jgi:addiction module HigA family antidote
MLPVHPGRILQRELAARSLSANRLALALRVPSGRITAILNAKRGITPETALRLGRYFGNSAQSRLVTTWRSPSRPWGSGSTPRSVTRRDRPLRR